MTKEQSFSILGIEPTDDEDSITKAYRAELPGHHPEDDPQGFKLLREAYEEALRIARENGGDEEISTTDFADASTPVAAMMNRVMDIYADYGRRIDPAVWEELLSDPVFSDFEYEVEARYSILLFISEHFRMPTTVYGVLDKALLIGEHAVELKERLPENFVEFLTDSATMGDDGWEFRFEALSDYPVPDRDQSIDRFIGELLSEIGRNPSDDAFATDEVMKRLNAYGMSHPYLDLLSMRVKAKREEEITPEEIERVASYREKYSIDQRVLNDTIIIYAYAKENDRLKALCDSILDDVENERHVEPFAKYYAYYHLGRLALENEEYEEALDKLASASGISYSSAVRELLEKVGKQQIELLTKKDSLTDEESARLAEVFRVTEQPKEGVEYFAKNPDRRADTSEFSYHMACLYLMSEAIDDLFTEVKKGKEFLEDEHAREQAKDGEADEPKESEETVKTESDMIGEKAEAAEPEVDKAGKKEDSPEKKEKDYIRHRGKFRCLEAQGLLNRAKKNKEDKDAAYEDLTEALKILDEVEEETPDLAYFDDMRMSIYRERDAEGDADRIIDIAERMLSEDESHYNAASNLQAAYEMKRDGQGVISAFHRAREIFDKDPEIYERAMRVYIDYEEYDPVIRIAEAAEQAGAESDKITACREFALAMKTEDEKERMEHLLAAVEKQPGMVAAEYQLGICYYNQARAEDDANEKAVKDLHQKAYDHLKYAADHGFRGVWLYWVLANYSEDREDRVAAINYMRYVIDNSEDAVDQLSRVGSWAQMEYYDTHIEEYGDISIEYCNRSDEANGEQPATFFDRGYVYYVRGDYENSIVQFLGLIRVVEKLEDNEENLAYHTRLRGTAYEVIAEDYLYLHDFDRAIEYGKKALCEFETPRFYHRQKSIYRTIYQAYLWKKDFKNGILYFDGEIARFSKPDHWNDSDRGRELSYENMRKMKHFVRNLSLCDGEKARAISLSKELNGDSLKLDERTKGFSWTWEKKRADDLFWLAQSFSDMIGFNMRQTLKGAHTAWKREYDRSRLHFEDDATYGQLTETRSYINFLRLMAQQLTIFGYDDAWADDILHRAEYAANLLGDRFGDWDDLYNWWMWNAYFRGDHEAAVKYGEKYRVEWGKSHKYTNDRKLDLKDAIQDDFNHRKSGLFTLCQIAAATNDTASLEEYLEQMSGCRNCPQCMYKTCYEELAMQAWLHYLQGDTVGARDLAERSLRLTWDHNCDYTEMLIYRRLS